MSNSKPANFFGHTANYAVGNIVRHAVGFAMLPIYTRFLSPADYGVIALLAFALALFEPVFGARLSAALPKFYFEAQQDHEKRAVIWTALGLTGLVSTIGATGIVVMRGVGASVLFGDQKYAAAFGIFAVNLLTRPLEDTGMMYLRIHERSRLFLSVSITKLLLQLALNLLLVVYLEKGVVGAILSGVISTLLIGGALTAYVAAHEAPAFDAEMMRKMLRFSWPLWIAGFGGLYVGSSGGMYLRIFGSLPDVGRLELALKFATAVSMLIWSPFAQQWTPMSYRIYREGNRSKQFQVAFVGISAAMFVGGLGISVFAKPVIGLMATKSFYGAASAVPILTLGFILNDLRSFFNFGFLVTDHTKVSGLCQYVMAAVITIGYVILVPRYGLMGAAVAQCIAFFVGFIYSSVLSRRYFNSGVRMGPLIAVSIIGITTYIVCALVSSRGGGAVVFVVQSAIYIGAVILIGVVAIRAIASVDSAIAQYVPRLLRAFVRIT